MALPAHGLTATPFAHALHFTTSANLSCRSSSLSSRSYMRHAERAVRSPLINPPSTHPRQRQAEDGEVNVATIIDGSLVGQGSASGVAATAVFIVVRQPTTSGSSPAFRCTNTGITSKCCNRCFDFASCSKTEPANARPYLRAALCRIALTWLGKRNDMPLRMAFCWTAAGVRPNAFAAATTDPSLARRFSMRRSMVVHRAPSFPSCLVVMVVTSMTAAHDVPRRLIRGCPVHQASCGLYVLCICCYMSERRSGRGEPDLSAAIQVPLGTSLAASAWLLPTYCDPGGTVRKQAPAGRFAGRRSGPLVQLVIGIQAGNDGGCAAVVTLNQDVTEVTSWLT